MDFLFSEPQKKLRDAIRTLAEESKLQRLDRVAVIAKTPFWPKLAEAGLWGFLTPSACGGRDCAPIEVAIIFEEMARSAPLIALALAEHNMLSIRHLERFGDAHQREKWLAPAVQAPTLGSWCPADEDRESPRGASETRAEKKGGDWVLNGSKMTLANGGQADWTIVTATTNASIGKESLSSFILDKGTAGLRWEKAGESRVPEERGIAGLILEDVRVPAEDLLGHEGAGARDVLSLLDACRGCLAALCLGLAANALETCVALSRKRFAALTSGQKAPKEMAILADRMTELDRARLMTYRAAFVEARTSGPCAESEAACDYAVDLALKSVAFSDRFVPAKRRGRQGPSLQERSSAIVRRWLMTRSVLEGV